jgi:uncharacterized coiled-coil protein SlyX
MEEQKQEAFQIKNNLVSFRATGVNAENILKLHAILSEKVPGINPSAFYHLVIKTLLALLSTGEKTVNVQIAAPKTDDGDPQVKKHLQKSQSRISELETEVSNAKKQMKKADDRIEELESAVKTADKAVKEYSDELANLRGAKNKLPVHQNGENTTMTVIIPKDHADKVIESTERNIKAGHSTDFSSYFLFMFRFCKHKLTSKHF